MIIPIVDVRGGRGFKNVDNYNILFLGVEKLSLKIKIEKKNVAEIGFKNFIFFF